MIERPFAFSYEFDGKSWVFDLPAKDWTEVQRRVRAIGLTGKVDGPLHATISVPTFNTPRTTEYLVSFLIGVFAATAILL